MSNIESSDFYPKYYSRRKKDYIMEKTKDFTTGSQLTHTVTTVITGLSMGITVFVGQKIGEKKLEEAGKAIGTGILLFIILGILMSAFLVIFTGNLAELLHAPTEAFTQTCDYITVCGYGMLFICLYNLLGAIFRGIGDSKTPLLTVFIACICNIIGDLLFVAGSSGWNFLPGHPDSGKFH